MERTHQRRGWAPTPAFCSSIHAQAFPTVCGCQLGGSGLGTPRCCSQPRTPSNGARDATGIPEAGQAGKGRTPQIWPGPLLESPSAASPLPGRQRKGRNPGRITRGGIRKPMNKRNRLCPASEEWVTGKAVTLLLLEDDPDTRLFTLGLARRSRRCGGSARPLACSVGQLSGRGKSADAAARDRSGLAAAAALRARVLPESSLACAAAPGGSSAATAAAAATAKPKPSEELTRELQDTWLIRTCLSQGAVLQQHRMKLETKPKKSEDRVLALTSWHLHLFPLKVPAKVESSFNVLEICAFNTLSQNQILVETEHGMVSMRLPSVDQVTRHISSALSKVCPGPGCLIQRGNADTPEGPRDTSPNETSTSTTQSICGGFSETYAACDYNGLHRCEEVQWVHWAGGASRRAGGTQREGDVDTIDHAEHNQEFNLLDFSHLESWDLALMVAALAYNQWLTKLYYKDLQLDSEVLEQVLHTLSKSGSLEELALDNAGLESDFVQKLAGCLGENGSCVLHTLTPSHGPIKDKDFLSLSQLLLCFPTGLTKLCLAKTAISPQGLQALGQTFGANPAFAKSLRYLDLSKNPGLLAMDEANSFLAQPNALVHLDLSRTDCAINLLLGTLLHGCCSHLTYLNLARNRCSQKKGREALPAFKQFFSSTYTLSHINLSATRLPLEALRALLQGVSLNSHLSDLHLDLSSCELRSAGAQDLQEQLGAVTCVGSLDLSDNGSDSDLLTLVPALGKNSIQEFKFLGKNFNVKAKTLEEILHKLVQLIQEEDCSPQSLSVVDSQLKLRTSILIDALGSNTCLAKVDLSSDGMEDIAKMLSKALQINSSLRTILWDRNNAPALGFLDIARALESNDTLRFMYFPVSEKKKHSIS
ncbi:LOW QUALITY PROTEIN: capping protein, Arp2/3 and myosin-I linker protein 3-like [Dugong dugon]